MRRARARRRSDWLGVALILLAVLTLGALSTAGFLLRPPPTDPETLCRTDAPLGAHTFILVDATDRLEARHRRKLKAVVQQEGQRLARHERLTLATIRADRPQEPRVLFSLCNPGDGRSANPLFQNTRKAQERWEAAFGETLDRAIRRAGAGRGAESSPILSGLRAAVADPDFGPEIPSRRIVLVSDLLEFTPGGFSLYPEDATFTAWRTTAVIPPPDLDNISVRVVTLDRPANAAAQTRARNTFWSDYFSAAAASRVAFDPSP